jgi:hypothetical protein
MRNLLPNDFGAVLVKSALLSQKLHDATLHELHKNVKWMGRQINCFQATTFRNGFNPAEELEAH